MNRWKKLVVGSAIGLALLGGAMGTALADEPAPGAGPGWGRGGGGGMGLPAIGATVLQDLGITQPDLCTLRQEGQSLAQIAQAKGVSQDELVADILSAKKERLDQAVQDGRLTQDQADAAYARMQTQVQSGITRTEVGPNRPADAPRLGLGPGGGQGPRAQEQGGRFGPGSGGRWGAGR